MTTADAEAAEATGDAVGEEVVVEAAAEDAGVEAEEVSEKDKKKDLPRVEDWRLLLFTLEAGKAGFLENILLSVSLRLIEAGLGA